MKILKFYKDLFSVKDISRNEENPNIDKGIYHADEFRFKSQGGEDIEKIFIQAAPAEFYEVKAFIPYMTPNCAAFR
jgi:hypothetical protein